MMQVRKKAGGKAEKLSSRVEANVSTISPSGPQHAVYFPCQRSGVIEYHVVQDTIGDHEVEHVIIERNLLAVINFQVGAKLAVKYSSLRPLNRDLRDIDTGAPPTAT